MNINISVAKLLDSLREDAYINITDEITGEMLFHGMRNDKNQYTATTLFEPYAVVGLNRYYAHRGMEMQLVVSLYIVRRDALEDEDLQETLAKEEKD